MLVSVELVFTVSLHPQLAGGYLGELLTSLSGSELARVLQLVEGVASSLSSHHHTLTTHTTSQVHQPKLEAIKGPKCNMCLCLPAYSFASVCLSACPFPPSLPLSVCLLICQHRHCRCVALVLAALWPCPTLQVPRSPPLPSPPHIHCCSHYIHM